MIFLLSQIILLLFILLLFWAAIEDWRRFTIPNRISLSIALLFVAHGLIVASPASYGSELMYALKSIAIAGAVFTAGAGLFALGVAGGGDVKLIAAVALWAGPSHILLFLAVTACVGGVLSVAFLSPWQGFFPGPPLPDRGATPLASHAVLPYGAAIAVGGLIIASPLLSGF